MDPLTALLLTVCGSCITFQVLFLVFYWVRIRPLRHDVQVFAPPILITFAYHAIVTAMVGNVIYGQILRLRLGLSTTWATWVWLILIVALNVAVWAFYEFYRVRLEAQRRTQATPSA